ncbi:MAG TPA: hypothetical protein VEK78_06225 [Gemmatimonadales bacterium]|nr:hypothetical protein [Gemmatimonadales bacterium]
MFPILAPGGGTVVAGFRSSWLRACGVMLLTLWGGACVWIFRHVAVEPIDRPADTLTVVSPVKAHLLDGSTVVYPRGVTVAHDSLHPLAGVATRYDAGLRPSTALPVPLDSVVGMEAFRTEVEYGQTIMVSTLATAGTFFGTLGLLVAIFGSCPTYYADSAGTPVLEAEGFSYSIAPLFEARDVDRLRVGVGPDGALRLEVRNEALESHYLNQLELLEVNHGAAELVLPDEWGRPLAVRGWVEPAAVTDRSGRDLRALLATTDGHVFRTDHRLLDAAGTAGLEDYIDVTLPRPPGAESVAVVLRARNSLLNTVLLYDVMLGARGARALDWVGSDLERVGPALELGNWYATRMGMRVAVWRGGGYQDAGRIRDTGPIAWKDVAIVVPVPREERDSLRLRLSFVADNWRIDRLGVAAGVRRPFPRPVLLARVLRSDGGEDSVALRSLRAADAQYLQTGPGQRFDAVFEPGRPLADSLRTFLLASQGYYVEWIRPAWVRAGHDTTRFTPSDAGLVTALERWRAVRDEFEQRFEATRLPVR